MGMQIHINTHLTLVHVSPSVLDPTYVLYLCTRFALYIPCPLNAEPAPSSSVEFFLTERLARVSTCVYELSLMSYLITERVITNCAWEIESLRCQIEFTSSSANTTFPTSHALSSLHPTPSSETDPNMGSVINHDGLHYTLLYYVSIPKPFSALAYQILSCETVFTVCGDCSLRLCSTCFGIFLCPPTQGPTCLVCLWPCNLHCPEQTCASIPMIGPGSR